MPSRASGRPRVICIFRAGGLDGGPGTGDIISPLVGSAFAPTRDTASGSVTCEYNDLTPGPEPNYTYVILAWSPSCQKTPTQGGDERAGLAAGLSVAHSG